MLGMQMYIDNFAGTIKGVEDKLPISSAVM